MAHPSPKTSESKYCQLMSDLGVKKAHLKQVNMKPDSLHIMSESNSGKTNHNINVTHGTFDHDKAEVKIKNKQVNKGIHFHQDGSIHNPNASSNVTKVQFNPADEAPQFTLPTNSQRVTAGYGLQNPSWPQSHQGIDLKARTGTPVYASADGTVQLVTTEPKWGNRVILKHANGYQTLYGHMNGFKVKRGQSVKAGDIIGNVGSTGQSTGPHLHFEIRKDGQTLDPSPMIF